MLRWLRAGIEANLDRHQILYPWWVPLTSHLGQVACVVVCLALRDALWPLDPLLVCLPLVMVSALVQFTTNRWLPWYVDILGTVVAASLLLARPADGVVDLAPAMLALATAEITARDGIGEGLAVAGIGQLVLIGAALGPGLDGAPLYTFVLVLGFVVGSMLLWQMRALVAERKAREQAWDQATTAERERIAREIHDLVAHSLSISLLQVTGARRALRDVTGTADPDETAEAVAEVDAALADAEQVGRRAMAEIRRTVSAMADGAADRHALPGAGDIAALVREMSGAGLEVEYDEQGDPASLPAATGLGLYRIAQESLANVARHGGADARAPGRAPGQRFGHAPADHEPAPRRTGARRRPRLRPGRHAGQGRAARRHPRGRTGRGRLGRRRTARAGTPRGRPALWTHDQEAGTRMTPDPHARPVRVVLVDDQELVRSGLRRILRRRDGFDIVAECGDGSEVPAALDGLADDPATGDDDPGVDVVVMDLRMRTIDGITATAGVVARPAGPPVLVLTTFDDDETLSGALRAGASGFLLKDSSADDLIRAVRTVADGGHWLDPSVTGRVLQQFRSGAPVVAARANAATDPLTARELEVLQAIALGRSNGEIADELVISELTVKSHVGRIFTKLGLRDRPAAIVYAYDNGLVAPGRS